ncbi:MAG: DegT/DnrJ/EryC1/StrS family aminotransferase [Alphaproteobacteria bacterium]|uniref:DegT/DnrJ/EryC1/StrS family aminotransferase n=1 Tax=Roseibium sp. TaxID=1936156 RepID=UPI00326EE5DE
MIPIFEPKFDGNEREYLMSCIDSGWISSQGKFIEQFESSFAAQSDMPIGVATSNCTTALHLALVSLGIGPGDEVICPDLTFIAPINMVALCGATPVLIDIESDSWAIDPDLIEARITEKTKALIVVHPFGHTADMTRIMEICDRRSIPVIEDVAEAPRALCNGQVAGSFGVMSCYSFFANKIMTTGEGGIVLTKDPDLETRLRTYRDHGMSREKRYFHIVAGYNYRMTNMQAAVGLAQLERLDDILMCRHAQDMQYRNRLAAGSSHLTYRPVLGYCQPVHWLATITLQNAEQRTALLTHLSDNGIDGRQMVFPVHEAVPYVQGARPEDYPVATSISHRSLHLPSGTGLSEAQVDEICDLVLEWVTAHGE